MSKMTFSQRRWSSLLLLAVAIEILSNIFIDHQIRSLEEYTETSVYYYSTTDNISLILVSYDNIIGST